MKANKLNDERLQKNLEQTAASMYPVLLILTTAVLVVKIALKLHPIAYLFEIIALTSSLSYYVISTAWKKALFVNGTDEAIINIRRTTKFHCYWLHSFIAMFMPLIVYTIGHYFYPAFFEEQVALVFNATIYIFISGMPIGITGNKMAKKGDLLVWNSEKSKTRILKTFKWILIGQTILNVAVHVGMYLFNPASLLNVILLFVIMQSLWIFMYFQIRRNLLAYEKNANKAIELLENSVNVEEGGCEKQKDETSTRRL